MTYASYMLARLLAENYRMCPMRQRDFQLRRWRRQRETAIIGP